MQLKSIILRINKKTDTLLKKYIFILIKRDILLMIQLIAWSYDIIQHDLDDAGESSVIVCIVITISSLITSKVRLVSTNLLILQSWHEDSSTNNIYHIFVK